MQVASIIRLTLAILLLLPLSLAQADIYKCAQADGSLLYSDSPCTGATSGTRLSQQELDSRTSNLGKLAPTPPQEEKPLIKKLPTTQQLTQDATSSYQRIRAGELPNPRQMPLLVWVGLAIMFFAGVWFLVTAFRASIWWGLGCLLIPLVSLVFLILHWQEAKQPFLLQLLGFGILFASLLL